MPFILKKSYYVYTVCVVSVVPLIRKEQNEEVLSLQPMIPHKRFDIFPADWGMLRRSRYVQIFL